MTTTNRSKFLRSAAGLFVLSLVLLSSNQSHAQSLTQTLVHWRGPQ